MNLPWFRAHFRDYEKAPRSTDLTMWTAEHAAIAEEAVATDLW